MREGRGVSICEGPMREEKGTLIEEVVREREEENPSGVGPVREMLVKIQQLIITAKCCGVRI